MREIEDDGTMPENVAKLEEAIVGRRIVSVERTTELPPRLATSWIRMGAALRLTLDDGRSVYLGDTSDCCAYTELCELVEHLPTVEHVITSVRASEDFTHWYIVADMGDVLELQVDWSPGNPFYYAYGFEIVVEGEA